MQGPSPHFTSNSFVRNSVQFAEYTVEQQPTDDQRAFHVLEDPGLINIHFNIINRCVHLDDEPCYQVLLVLSRVNKIFLEACKCFLTLTINNPIFQLFEKKDDFGLPHCFTHNFQASLIFYFHARKYPQACLSYKNDFLSHLATVFSLSKKNKYAFTYKSEERTILLHCDTHSKKNFSIQIDSPSSAYLFYAFLNHYLKSEEFFNNEDQELENQIVDFLAKYKSFSFVSCLINWLTYRYYDNLESEKPVFISDLHFFISKISFFKKLAAKKLIDCSLVKGHKLLNTVLIYLKHPDTSVQSRSLYLQELLIKKRLIDLPLINKFHLVEKATDFLYSDDPDVLDQALSLLKSLVIKGAIDEYLVQRFSIISKIVTLLSLPQRGFQIRALQLLNATESKGLINQSIVKKSKLISNIVSHLDDFQWETQAGTLYLLGNLAQKGFILKSLVDELELIPKIISLLHHNNICVQTEAFRTLSIFANKQLMTLFPMTYKGLENIITSLLYHQNENFQCLPFCLLHALLRANLLDDSQKKYVTEKMTLIFLSDTQFNLVRPLALVLIRMLVAKDELFKIVSKVSNLDRCFASTKHLNQILEKRFLVNDIKNIFVLLMDHPLDDVKSLASRLI